LAFQTTDQALAEAFQDCLGKVKNAVVITRGRRSLGYGFVEFDSHESAVEGVKSKNNTQLKGRTLKVELASDNPPVRAEREPRNLNSPSPPAAGGQQSAADNGPAPRRRKRNNNLRRRRVDNNNPNPENNNSKPPVGVTGASGKPSLAPVMSGSGGPPPKPVSSSSGTSVENRPMDQRGPPKPRVRRRVNNNQNFEDRVLSRTAVFVANLPFSVKDEELLVFFKDNNAKTAHVVVTRNGRSRGYGFVDFDSEVDQGNAIKTKNNLKFTNSDRQITVTPSYKTQELQVAVI
jgi:RNA recognition motif-containing protein